MYLEMSARGYCLTVLILMMLARRITSSPSLVTSNEYMGELIDVLSNIGDTMAEHRTAESLDTIAGAVKGQQAAFRSLIQDQQKTLSEILQGHYNDMEKLLGAHGPTQVFCSQEPNSTFNGVTGVTEEVEKLAQDAEDRAKQIEVLSQRFETTKREIDEEISQKMEQLQTLKGETRLDLDQVRSAMEDELKTLGRHTDDAILQLQKDLEESRQQANEVKSVMNGQVINMQQLLDSVNKSLNEEMTTTKAQFFKALEEFEVQTTTADATFVEDVKELYSKISSYHKTSMDSIKSIEEKTTVDTLQVKAQITAANSKLQEIEGEIGSTREQLKAKIDNDKTWTLKKLEEGTSLVQEIVQGLRQDLTSYKATTQQSTSSLDAKVDEVSQGVTNTLEKITTELKETKVYCTNQTTQNKAQMTQTTQKLHSDLEVLETKLQTHESHADKDLTHLRQDFNHWQQQVKSHDAKLDDIISQVQKDLSINQQQTGQLKSEIGDRFAGFQELFESSKTNIDQGMQETKAQLSQSLEELRKRTATLGADVKKELGQMQSKVDGQKTSTDSIRTAMDKSAASVNQIKDQINNAIAKLSGFEQKLKSIENELKSKIERGKTEVTKKVQEYTSLLQQTEHRLQQELKSHKETTQKEVSSLEARITKTDQGLAGGVKKMAADLKVVSDRCTNQITMNQGHTREAIEQLRSEFTKNQEAKLNIHKENTNGIISQVRKDFNLWQQQTNQLQVELGLRVDGVQKLLESTKKSLGDGLKTTKDQHGRRLDQLQGDTAELATNLKQEMEQLKTKTQETASQFSSKIEKVDKGLASAVTKMKTDVEGTKQSCAEQASKSESHVKQVANQIQSDLKKHEAKLQQFQGEVNGRLSTIAKQVDAVGAKAETAVKEAKASFTQQLQSFRQSLQSALDQTKQRLGVLEHKANEHEIKSTSSITSVKNRLSAVEIMAKNSADSLASLQPSDSTLTSVALRKDLDIASSHISILQTLTPPIVCPPPFERRGYHCFYVTRTDRDTWQGARARCQAIGGDLAFAFDAESMSTGLRHLRFPHNYYWVGASRLGEDGTWRWINGARVNMTYAWGRNQPDNRAKNEECMAFHTIKLKYLNDVPCHRPAFFICQYVENIYTKY